MSDQTADHRKILGLPSADAPFISQGDPDEKGWVSVSVNWPRVQSAFARGALMLRDAPKSAVKALAVPSHAALESLKHWQDAVRNWLTRLFQSVRRFFSLEPAPAASQRSDPVTGKPQASGETGKIEPKDLSARVPKEVAPTLADSLEAFLGSVVPPHSLTPHDLPADFPPASVSALAAVQANVALRQYRDLDAIGDRVLSEMTSKLKSAPIAGDLAAHSPAAVGAALLELVRKDSNHPLVSLVDPSGEIANLARQHARVSDLRKNFLEAAALNLHVAARAGLPKDGHSLLRGDGVDNLLRKHGVIERDFRTMLLDSGLTDAHEAFTRRADPSFELPKPSAQLSDLPGNVTPLVTPLAAYGVGAGPAPGSLAEAVAKATVAHAATAEASTAAPSRFSTLSAYAGHFEEREGAVPGDPDSEALQTSAPRG